jgi:hypothetical protein
VTEVEAREPVTVCTWNGDNEGTSTAVCVPIYLFKYINNPSQWQIKNELYNYLLIYKASESFEDGG